VMEVARQAFDRAWSKHLQCAPAAFEGSQ